MGRSITTSSESAFITVPTSIGFNAGDYVYNQTGGYGRIADNAVSTATFPFGATDPTNTFQIGGNAQSQLTWVETAGTAKLLGRAAAQLANGNYVIPYVPNIVSNSNSMFPWFKIVDASGNTVVAATQVDSNANNPIIAGAPLLGALALPNGNFVIIYRAWANGVGSVPRMLFRIYNSSGIAQTAVINDSTADLDSLAGTAPSFAVRSDSSFVMVAYSSATLAPFFRVYNGSTGATVYSGTWGAGRSDPYGLAVVVRSDNSFVMLQQQNSTIYYDIRNATAVQQAASSVSSSYAPLPGFSACLLASDVVRIVISNSSGIVSTYTITGTSISAESLLFTTTGWSSGTMAAAASYSSGSRFIVVYNGTAGGPMCYRIFNAAGTQIAIGGLSTDIPVRSIPGSMNYMYPTVIETSTTLRVYVPLTRSAYGSASSSGMLGAGTAYVEINKTNNLVTPAQSAVVSTGSTSAIAVSGYVRSAATPTSASFFAANTSTEAVTTTAMQQVFPQTVVESTVCDSTQVMGLASGGFAYLYKYGSSPFTIRIAVYNASAVLQNTITVDTGANIRGGARFFTLNNGNIIVVYPKTANNGSSADTIAFKRYSSTFTELGSGTLVSNATLYTGYTAAGGFAVSPLGPDSRFVLGYTNFSSSQSRYAVFDSTGTLITAADTGSTSPRAYNMWGGKTGIFGFTMVRPSNNNVQLQVYIPATSTTYTQLTTYQTFTDVTYGWYGAYFEAGPDNGVPLLFNNSGGGYSSFQYMSGSEPIYGAAATIPFYQNSNSGALQMAVGRTASNVTVFAGTDMPGQTAGQLSVAAYWASPQQGQGVLTALQNIALSCFPASSGGSCPSVAPFANDSCIISLLNTSGFPTFYALYPYVSTQFSTITGGVSVSNPVSLTPASRFVLVGVAATTAAAGGTGLVQTKGNAQLSSSYSASTPYQAFDFRNQVTFGAVGTVNGRIVTLES